MRYMFWPDGRKAEFGLQLKIRLLDNCVIDDESLCEGFVMCVWLFYVCEVAYYLVEGLYLCDC